MPTKLAQILGGKASASKQRETALASYYSSPNICLECGLVIEVGDKKVAEIRRRKFCSSSCSCKYSNKSRIRNKKAKLNKETQVKPDLIGSITKGSLFGASLTSGDSSWQRARACVTKHARRIAKKNGLISSCKICGYSIHVEVCHIKAVKGFSDAATLNEINSPTNLVGLCPNHHWEFDHNGLII